MRIPLAKLYRAFPELDRFTDEECERYVIQVTRDKRFRWWVEGLAELAWVAASVGVMVVTPRLLAALGAPLRVEREHWLALSILVVVGGALLFGYIVRDRHFIRAVRRAMHDARCPRCKHSLVGLPLLDGGTGFQPESGAAERVRCPECGSVHRLADLGLRVEHIAPRPETVQPAHPVTPS